MKRAIALLLICSLLPIAVGGCVVKETKEPISKEGYRRFVLIPQKDYVGGIAAGIAYHFGTDLHITQVVVIVSWFTGVGALVSIVIFLVTPEASRVPPDFDQRTGG